MINEKELNISNKSYINKDFGTIYPEEIDIFKTLTDKYDPETSNESDPMIVLLKLGAFLGDKLNYNIDVNVLETKLPSVTQESNLREICSELGYNVKYYRSAEVLLNFSYNGDELDDETSTKYFTLPALTTVIGSSQDDSINFVLTQSVTFIKGQEVTSIPALQGSLATLTVGDTTTIQLSNLDDNNRLYFPETMVAENGVFITNVGDDGSSFWERVDNLNLSEPASKVFKFSYDSVKGLPYVEFPSDIASLIGSGLVIRYIITKGEAGNIKANYLDKIISPTSVTIYVSGSTDTDNTTSLSLIDNEDLYINNPNSSINGANPETINEAYNNFKKTIGTFETLVSCRDYANYIYNNIFRNDGYNIVSNVQVCDRRDDINFGGRLLTFNSYGNYYTNIVSDDITPFDLCLYPLNPILNSYSVSSYNSSFLPLTSSYLNTIKNELEDTLQTISHDYKDLPDDCIYLIKNWYNLDAKITTTYKVNAYEQAEIISNVQQALAKNFNARNVDYGCEIPYENILKVIQNADSRIQYVSLAEPELSTSLVLGNGTEENIFDYTLTQPDNHLTGGLKDYLSIIAKNVLAGKVSLFDFDDDFNFDLGQLNGEIHEQLSKVTTGTEITLVNNSTYSLKENEIIQIIGPNLIEDTVYSLLKYYFKLGKGTGIRANTNYKLTKDDCLVFVYTNSENVEVQERIPTGTIIRPNFDLYTTAYQFGSGYTDNPIVYSGSATVTYYAVTSDIQTRLGLDASDLKSISSTQNSILVMFNLSTTQTITTLEENKIELTSKTPCYWITNNEDNILFPNSLISEDKDTITIVLKEGENFFYTNLSYNSLVSLGSGTSLTIKKTSALMNKSVESVDLEDIVNEGVKSLEDKWLVVNFNANDSLTIQENQILTLGEGSSITASFDGDTNLVINNVLSPLDTKTYTIRYSLNGAEETELQSIDIGTDGWKIQSRLDIHTSRDNPQSLHSDSDLIASSRSTQSITFTPKEGEPFPIEDGYYFVFNESVDINGGIDVALNRCEVSSNGSLTPTYPLSLYKFMYDITSEGNYNSPTRDGEDIANISFTEKSEEITYTLPALNKVALMLFYWNKSVTSNGSIIITSTDSNLRLYNSNLDYADALELKEGINILEFKAGTKEVTISNTSVESGEDAVQGTLSIGTLDYINGINEDLGLGYCADLTKSYTSPLTEDKLFSELLTIINQLDVSNIFYYNSKIDNSKIIESTNLFSPYCLYDYNNIANKMTLSQINLDIVNGSKIEIVRSSRLQ